MTTYTVTPYLPEPQTFEAAVLACLCLKPDIHYSEICSEIPAIENALKRLEDVFQWPCSWMRHSKGYVWMRALSKGTADQARAYGWNLMSLEPGYIDKLFDGMRSRLTTFLDSAVNHAHEDAAAQDRKLVEVSTAMKRHLPEPAPLEFAEAA